MGSEAELEGFYRFINNDGFSPGAILAPHVAATLQRARDNTCVVVVHDTTQVAYGGLARRDGWELSPRATTKASSRTSR